MASLFTGGFSISHLFSDKTLFSIDDLLTVTFCESAGSLGSNMSSNGGFDLSGVESPRTCGGMYCAISVRCHFEVIQEFHVSQC